MIRKMVPRVSPLCLLAFAWIFLLLAAPDAAAPVAPTPQVSERADVNELWYRLDLGGAPAGWMVVRELRDGDRQVTETETQMTVERNGTPVRLEVASRFVESADGRPIEASARQLLGPQPIETGYHFRDDHVLVRTRHGARETEARRPWPNTPFATPARAQKAVVAALDAGVDSFTVHSLDPLVGLEVATTEWQRVGDGAAPADGASRWQQRMSATPGLVVTVELDAEGTMVSSRTPFLGTEMTLTRTDRAGAQVASRAPELLAKSFVFPDRTIARPRALRRAVFRLRASHGAPIVPSLGQQRVTAEADATRVTVDLGRPPPDDDARGDADTYLRASTYLDHRDPAIRALAERALAGLDPDAPTAARAEEMRRLVGRHLVAKNLDTTFATAGEAAAARAGDCTEHGVLLAALLRADGIPSRVVAGLVYVDRFAGERDLFAFHMWAQAWTGERWIDLDATQPVPFDAAHIALAVSALDDEPPPLLEMAAILPLLGDLDIEVVATDTDDP